MSVLNIIYHAIQPMGIKYENDPSKWGIDDMQPGQYAELLLHKMKVNSQDRFSNNGTSFSSEMLARALSKNDPATARMFAGHETFLRQAMEAVNAHKDALKNKPFVLNTDHYRQFHAISGYQLENFLQYLRHNKRKIELASDDQRYSFNFYRYDTSGDDFAAADCVIDIQLKDIPKGVCLEHDKPFALQQSGLSSYHAQLALNGNQVVGINLGGHSPNMADPAQVNNAFSLFADLFHAAANSQENQFWQEFIASAKKQFGKNLSLDGPKTPQQGSKPSTLPQP